MNRYALITLAWERDNPEPYMPHNYRVLYVGSVADLPEDARPEFARPEHRVAVIGGHDDAGWTLESYVLPRLVSGSMFGKEIDLSHPIMKHVLDPVSGGVPLP